MDMNLSKFQEMVKVRRAWHALVHGIAMSWTQLSNWATTERNQSRCDLKILLGLISSNFITLISYTLTLSLHMDRLIQYSIFHFQIFQLDALISILRDLRGSFDEAFLLFKIQLEMVFKWSLLPLNIELSMVVGKNAHYFIIVEPEICQIIHMNA